MFRNIYILNKIKVANAIYVLYLLILTSNKAINNIDAPFILLLKSGHFTQ